MQSEHISIIDFGMGNLSSVQRACKAVGLFSIITNDKDVIENSCGIILPGVGAFGDAMNNLKSLNLINSIVGKIEKGTPFMGICLGFQLLFSKSYEFGQHSGLNIFEGEVVRFESNTFNEHEMKVPQVQWNSIEPNGNRTWNDSLLSSIPPSSFFYFVHSFYVKPRDISLILSQTTYYDLAFCSSIQFQNIFACQFHPEKSGELGLAIYRSFKDSLHRT